MYKTFDQLVNDLQAEVLDNGIIIFEIGTGEVALERLEWILKKYTVVCTLLMKWYDNSMRATIRSM